MSVGVEGRRRAAVPGLGVALVLGLARRLPLGRLEIVLPGGSRRVFAGPKPGPEAVLVLRNGKVARRYLTGGAVGVAEGYVAGDWDSPDLAALLELLDRAGEELGMAGRFKGPRRLLERALHALRRNTRTGSRRNIHAHYDLGNAFFSAWLDPTLTYSSALFGPDADDLEGAQRAKYRRLARAIALAPGHRLLEIGSGWGGFALTAAKEFGAFVTSITVSREQHDLACQRVYAEGLGEKVEIRLQDYRDVEGRFDRIASIEMLEAVGERFWPLFFGRLRERLSPGGRAGVQTITIADERFDAYRRNVDFVQKYVFPGGMLPSPSTLQSVVAKAGLVLEDDHRFGLSYARTLAEWHRRFDAAWQQLVPLGFDERFRRLWKYYLAYCEAGFRSGAIDVTQVSLTPA